MIKIALTASALIFTAAIASAQVNQQGVDTVGRAQIDTPSIPASQKNVAQQQTVKIKASQLPPAVQKALQGNAYSSWKISDAYENKILKQYSVRMKKDKEIVFYTFDGNGKKIE